METVKLRPGSLYLLLLIAGAALAFLEYGALVDQQGSLLLTLAFWAGLAQGSIAIVAVTDFIGARWIASLRRELLCGVYLFPLLVLLLLLAIPRMSLYPWVEHPGRWLNETFFLLRNLILLLLAWWTAHRFARHSLSGDSRSKTSAVHYLFVFVASQSLIAFDIVMSLEYPWFSTLFGAYFFVESLYAGIALAALSYYFSYGGSVRLSGVDPRHLRDVGLLLFGFSVLWMGLFFAQYLLIWYGNLPEEVIYIAERITGRLHLGLACLILVSNFFVPFFLLMSRRAKEKPVMVAAVAAVVLTGIFAERLLMVLPPLSLHLGTAVLQSLLLLFIWMLAVYSHDTLLPEAAGGGAKE